MDSSNNEINPGDKENVDMGFIEKQIHQSLAQYDWSIQLKIAFSCRKLASEEHSQTLAGHVTVRAEDKTFWVNQLMGGFGNTTQSSVIRVNEDLKVVEGNGIANPGMSFHLWVYKARPDINSIVHTHPPFASALAMTGKELAVAHMDVAMFYKDCSYLSEWPGVPLADEEGQIISEALGNRHSLLLASHGILTTGRNIETATVLAIQFERACRLQLLAESVGTIKPIEDHHAQKAHDFQLGDAVVKGNFNSWACQILREQPDIKD